MMSMKATHTVCVGEKQTGGGITLDSPFISLYLVDHALLKLSRSPACREHAAFRTKTSVSGGFHAPFVAVVQTSLQDTRGVLTNAPLSCTDTGWAEGGKARLGFKSLDAYLKLP